MTTEQKSEITSLREQGYGYKKIAELTDVPVNTVKSFCRRSGVQPSGEIKKDIQDREDQMRDAPEETPVLEHFCLFCGKPVEQTPGKRKKKFCCDECRKRYWSLHRNELSNKVTRVYKCQHCGKEFRAYGKRGRKYCSQRCYFAGRFGEPGNNEA